MRSSMFGGLWWVEVGCGGLWWVAAWSAVSGPERTAGMTVREDGKLPIPVGDSHLPLSRRHELDGRQTLGHD